MTYEPSDRLHLWILTDPARPRAVGELRLIDEEFAPAERNAAADIDQYAEQIDRPFLRQQRDAQRPRSPPR